MASIAIKKNQNLAPRQLLNYFQLIVVYLSLSTLLLNKNTLSIVQQIILELTRYIMNQLRIKCHKENH